MPVDPAHFPTQLYDEAAIKRARDLLEAPPVQIGPYRVIERIGGGGMGEVYRAEQRAPIRREVAIKVIKLGMDTKAVIARFEIERQALALMDHPHIAKVLDAGADDSGRPYFVMEYVKGKPITDYADHNQCSISERLALFEQVCQAIQHAHHKGVIHRDLKPSNVLVSTHDGQPFARVIDFGIAKAVAQQLTDKTLFTLHNDFVGTPQYMSPEQAEGSLDIDTRSDVYSLGVLLYELLTGSTPFSKEDLRAAAFEQIKRLIVEVDPPKPSTRLSLNERSLPTLAASRRTEPRRLGMLVRGELDWIVMKALDKDRRRRYESPTSLANDVLAHLRGEPVQAAPPSTVYRVRKFVRKHQGPVFASSLVATVLVLGIIGTSWGYYTARLAEQTANDSEQRALQDRDAKDAALAAEITARQRADRARQEAIEARDAEKAQRERADIQAETATLRLYANSILLAQREWRDNFMLPVRRLLEDSPHQHRNWEWRYLDRVSRQQLLTLTGSKQPLTSVAYSPDGSRLAGGGWDSKLTIWDAVSAQQIAEIQVEAGTISAVAFSPDGVRVAAACTDGAIRLWDIPNGDVIAAYNTPGKITNQIAFDPTGTSIAAANTDGTVTVLEAASGLVTQTLVHGSQSVGAVAFSSDGSQLASGGSDGSLCCWNSHTGQLLQTFRGHTSEITSVAFSPGARLLASAGGWDQTIRLWEVGSGQQLHMLLGHENRVASVAFSPDGLRIASGGADHAARLWDVESGREQVVCRGHGDDVTTVAFSPDGTRLATSSWDGAVHVWDAVLHPESAVLHGDGEPAYCVTFTPDGRSVIVGHVDGALALWDVVECRRTHILRGHSSRVDQLAASGQRLASSSIDGTVILWDLSTGTRISELPGYHGVAFSPRGEILATGGSDGSVTLRDPDDGRILQTLPGHNSGVTSVWYSPDGGRLASLSQQSEMIIWEVGTWRSLRKFEAPNAVDPRQFAFSPDGSQLAVPAGDNVYVQDAVTGSQVCTLTGHNYFVHTAEFSPDGSRIVTASSDGTVKLWEATSGLELLTLRGHEFFVFAAAFSPDGNSIATTGYDGTVRLWEADSLSPEEHEARTQAALLTDLFGRHLLSEAVIRRIEAWPHLSDNRRTSLIEAARIWGESNSASPDDLNWASWDVVRAPGQPTLSYEMALLQAQAAERASPTDGSIVNTLGVAQYRLGQYAAALETLIRSDEMNSNGPEGSSPFDIAFLAMAQHQLGLVSEARGTLDRLRELMNGSDWAGEEEAQGVLREAEAVIVHE